MIRRIQGFAIPMAIFALLAVSFFVLTVSTLSSNLRNQVKSINQRQTLFNIAYSAYAEITARIHEKPWNDRFFKAGPAVESDRSLLDGTFDSYVCDAPSPAPVPGDQFAPDPGFLVDIYLRVRFQDKRKVYFWRILYKDDIFDISNRLYPVFFTELDEPHFPSGSSQGFLQILNDLLAERKNNRDNALIATRKIGPLTDVRDIARVLAAVPPGDEGKLPQSPGGVQPAASAKPPVGVFASAQEQSLATRIPNPGAPPFITNPSGEPDPDTDPAEVQRLLDQCVEDYWEANTNLLGYEMMAAHERANEIRAANNLPAYTGFSPETADQTDRQRLKFETAESASPMTSAHINTMAEVVQTMDAQLKMFGRSLDPSFQSRLDAARNALGQ